VSLPVSASLAVLELRARIFAQVRAFFAERGVLEVDTPALSVAATPDPALESIAAPVRALGDVTHYLHTSPEYAMKRLLAAGAGHIYQICRVFRDGELGRWHQPEFVMLEWYRVGFTEIELMDELEALVVGVMRACGRRLSSRRVTYRQAFEQALGFDPLGDVAALPALLRDRNVEAPRGLARDALLDLALGTVVVRAFPRDAVTFVHDYPASQAALAEIVPGTPPVAARFEAFVGGIELANGFRELTNAAEQRRRFEAELETRRRAGRPAPPLDEAFLAALDTGLPACAGVALGLDRLVALAAGSDEIAAAMSFAHRP
jgi:elongation factor P--(R)-beta-lysine ligase